MTDEIFARDDAADARAFYLQRTFRALLDAMAHPGEVVEVTCDIQGDPLDAQASGLAEPALALADVLLDAATTVAVAGDEGSHAAAVLARRTHATACEAGEAAFAFVPTAVRGDAARAFVCELSAGTLLDPHHGATCIVGCDTLVGVDRAGVRTGAVAGASAVGLWELSGPGIRTTARIELDRTEVMQARDARADEFPCGIDLVFVDGAGHVLCLPRTTHIASLEAGMRADRKGGASWDM